MDQMIAAILADKKLSEAKKRQIFNKVIFPCKNKHIGDEDCHKLFELAWTMAILSQNQLEKDVGFQVFLGWVPNNRSALANWLSEDKIKVLFIEEFTSGDKSRLFQLVTCMLENTECHSDSFSYILKYLRTCTKSLFKKPFDLKSMVAFVTFVIKFPDCLSISCVCLQLLKSLAHLQIQWPLRPNDMQDIEYAVDYIKSNIFEDDGNNLLFVVLNPLLQILSTNIEEPSFAVAAVIEVLPLESTQIEYICQNVVDKTMEDCNLELLLSRNLDWLRWPNSNISLLWIFMIFRACYKSGRQSILQKIFETKSGHVFANIIHLSTRKAAFKVLQYMVFTHQHVPTITEKIHNLLPDVILYIEKTLADNHDGFLECIYDLQKYVKIIISGGGAPTSSSIQMKACYEDWLLDYQYLPFSEPNSMGTSSNQEIPFKKITSHLVGLANLGNTCYINSVIQALNMTLSFRLNILERDHAPQHSVLVKLQETLTFLLLTKRPVYSPSAFVEASRPTWLQRGEQQDSQEYLNHLLDNIHEVTRDASSKSPIQEEFGLATETSYTCLNCNNVSVVVDNFFNLLLPFPIQEPSVESNPAIRLEDMLALYLEPEVLDGGNQYKCDNCNVLQKAERTVSIREAPKHLVLTLLRFEYSVQRRRRKLSTPVDFPKVLDLPTKSVNGVEGVMQYTLYAAVIHAGMSVDNGHYYTYACSSARSAELRDAGEKWFLFNDERVSQTSFDHLKYKCSKSSNETVYMLFYIQTSQRCLPSFLFTMHRINQRIREMVLLDNLKFIKEEEELKSKVKRHHPSFSHVIRRRDDSDDESPGTGGCGLGGGFGAFDSPSRVVF